MSMMTRFIRLWKADIHGVMDELEDKPLMLRQYLREMEEALEENKANLKGLAKEKKSLESEHEKLKEELKKTNSDIDSAIKKGKDDIAKFLIKKEIPLSRHIKDIEGHIKNLDIDLENARQAYESRKLDYERLKLKSREYLRKEEKSTGIFHEFFKEPYQDVRDEEIELELLKRKENITGGKNHEL